MTPNQGNDLQDNKVIADLYRESLVGKPGLKGVEICIPNQENAGFVSRII